MNEEEKKAIQTFEFFLDDISKNGGCTIDIDFQHKKEYEAMWRILNLIEKQQAEIGNWEIHCTIDLEREITELNNKNFEYKAEIEKKNKQINLMAKCMEIEGTGRKVFSCMFRQNEECNKNGCRICIKQYFEREIEKGDK